MSETPGAETSTTPPVEATAETPPTQETTQATPPENPLAPEPEAKTEPEAEAPAPLKLEDVSLPEGLEADEASLTAFLEIANAHNLNKDAANALASFYGENVKTLAEGVRAEIETSGKEAFTAMLDKWKQEALALPEMATEEKRAESNASIAKLLNTFGTPQVREALDLTGAGDHPAVVQFFVNLAKHMGEGSFVSGDVPNSAATNSRAGKLFGDMFQEK